MKCGARRVIISISATRSRPAQARQSAAAILAGGDARGIHQHQCGIGVRNRAIDTRGAIITPYRMLLAATPSPHRNAELLGLAPERRRRLRRIGRAVASETTHREPQVSCRRQPPQFGETSINSSIGETESVEVRRRARGSTASYVLVLRDQHKARRLLETAIVVEKIEIFSVEIKRDQN